VFLYHLQLSLGILRQGQYSGGRHLLCDSQGSHYQDAFVLIDPDVMSRDNSKQFGVTDLGSEGIDNFFAHQKCNGFCRNHWLKPHCPQKSSRIPCAISTSMSLTLGTQQSDADRKKKCLVCALSTLTIVPSPMLSVLLLFSFHFLLRMFLYHLQLSLHILCQRQSSSWFDMLLVVGRMIE
jgi:hypothetical protein